MSGRVRIIAGDLGGRTISCPESITRPTTDRVREALMSSVASRLGGFDGLSVCDAFAGSGACGIEALSRGARSAAFFDKDSGVVRTVMGNVDMLGLAAQAQVEQRDVLKRGLGGTFCPYDLIFLDPPYAMGAHQIEEMLIYAHDTGAATSGALVVYEHASGDDGLSCLAGLKMRTYGKTQVDIGFLT